MSNSKASKEKLKKRMHKGRPATRENLLSNKVAKEQKKLDFQFWFLNEQIKKNYPEPTERTRYINSLLVAMDEPSREIQPKSDIPDV